MRNRPRGSPWLLIPSLWGISRWQRSTLKYLLLVTHSGALSTSGVLILSLQRTVHEAIFTLCEAGGRERGPTAFFPQFLSPSHDRQGQATD